MPAENLSHGGKEQVGVGKGPGRKTPGLPPPPSSSSSQRGQFPRDLHTLPRDTPSPHPSPTTLQAAGPSSNGLRAQGTWYLWLLSLRPSAFLHIYCFRNNLSAFLPLRILCLLLYYVVSFLARTPLFQCLLAPGQVSLLGLETHGSPFLPPPPPCSLLGLCSFMAYRALRMLPFPIGA